MLLEIVDFTIEVFLQELFLDYYLINRKTNHIYSDMVHLYFYRRTFPIHFRVCENDVFFANPYFIYVFKKMTQVFIHRLFTECFKSVQTFEKLGFTILLLSYTIPIRTFYHTICKGSDTCLWARQM